MYAQKGELHDPKDQKGDHAVGRDALGLGNAIRQRQVARPDGTDHDTHGIAPVHILNSKPEDGQDHARDDGNI